MYRVLTFGIIIASLLSTLALLVPSNLPECLSTPNHGAGPDLYHDLGSVC